MRLATSPESRPMASGIMSERAMISGSRPNPRQCSARIRRFCVNVAWSTRVTFHSSANSATILSVRFSPRPPMTMRERHGLAFLERADEARARLQPIEPLLDGPERYAEHRVLVLVPARAQAQV